jgi:hypothetical protein
LNHILPEHKSTNVLLTSPQRPVFNPRAVHVGFVVDKVTLGQVFVKNFNFVLPVTIVPKLHTCLPTGTGIIGLFGTTVPRDSV